MAVTTTHRTVASLAAEIRTLIGGQGTATSAWATDADIAGVMNQVIYTMQNGMEPHDQYFMCLRYSFTSNGNTAFTLGDSAGLITITNIRKILHVHNTTDSVLYDPMPNNTSWDVGLRGGFRDERRFSVDKMGESVTPGQRELAFLFDAPINGKTVGFTYSYYHPVITSALSGNVEMEPMYYPIFTKMVAIQLLLTRPSEGKDRWEILMRQLAAEPIGDKPIVFGETKMYDVMLNQLVGDKDKTKAMAA